jgi:hypothetical protein
MEDDMKSGLKRSVNSTRDEISESQRHPQIAALAYEFWQARGCPEGTSEEDWFLAEREFAQREAENAGADERITAAEEGDETALRFPVRSEMTQPLTVARPLQRHA